MVDDTIDSLFSRRLFQLEEEFLDPIVEKEAFASFNSRWSSLVTDLHDALDTGLLSIPTISKAHMLAENIATVAQALLDLETLSDNVMTSLSIEASSILVGPSTPAPAAVITAHIEESYHSSSKTMSSSYIEPSYRWLLENIHEPYPSSLVRNTIARETGAARKDIDSWFVDARKRMGWNALRKASFSNKRVDIVDAATRFFVKDDPKRPLDPNIELEFASMEKRAKDLYCDKFSQSDLAVKLDMVVKNLTPDMKAKAKAEERRRRELQNHDAIAAISSYPSPDRSPNRSPEPVLLSPVAFEDETDTAPPESISMIGRKRRSPSAEPLESNSDNSTNRPSKRARLDLSTPTGVTFPTGLPSPASSNDEFLQTAESSTASASSTIPRPNRKRRLSDADGQGAPKRPHNLPVGPRVQAVSDPLPLSSALFDASAFDGWFKQQFDIPTLPVVDQPELSLQFDVEFGDISALTSTLTPLSSRYASPQAEDATSTMPTEEIVWNPTDIPSFELQSHDFNFEEFQSWLSDDSSHLPPVQVITPQPQDILAQIPSLGNDLSLKGFNDSFSLTTPMQAPEPFIVDPIPNFSWELSDYINMPSQSQIVFPDMFQNLLGIDSQDNGGFNPTTLKGFDTSYLVPSADSMAQTERAEKERKLFEMKEAARRLEEELAASR